MHFNTFDILLYSVLHAHIKALLLLLVKLKSVKELQMICDNIVASGHEEWLA